MGGTRKSQDSGGGAGPPPTTDLSRIESLLTGFTSKLEGIERGQSELKSQVANQISQETTTFKFPHSRSNERRVIRVQTKLADATRMRGAGDDDGADKAVEAGARRAPSASLSPFERLRESC
jgi:hypothetical protein